MIDIDIHKHVIECEYEWIGYLNLQEEKSLHLINHHMQMIKDKNFLHYIRTGRFLDE